MTIADLTSTGFQLVGALDAGKHGTFSVQQVKDELDYGDIFAFLERQLAGDIDLNLLNEDKRREIKELWLDLALAVNERRKFGVEQDGICLLIAYCLEDIQRQER